MPTDSKPFTPGMHVVFRNARLEQMRLGQNAITPTLFLLGIIKFGVGLSVQVLQNLHIDLQQLARDVEQTFRHRGANQLTPEILRAVEAEVKLGSTISEIHSEIRESYLPLPPEAPKELIREINMKAIDATRSQ